MRLTVQEWNALSAEEQTAREAEMPEEIFMEKSKAERERLTNANIEKDRKLKAATQQVEELNAQIQALKNAGASPGQISSLEEVRKQYLDDLEKDPLNANAKLATTMASRVVGEFLKVEGVKKSTLRKLRKDYPKDMEKFGEELEDILDSVTDPSRITPDSIMVMFNSVRGKSIDQQLLDAEARGRKKALEDAGIVAVDEGGGSDSTHQPTSSLTKEQEEEKERMGITEKEYKELLRARQAKDKAEGKTPRTLISPKH